MRDYSERLNFFIPGGAHTYSRGDDQFSENAPQILSKGKGCYVWDASGNKYLDYGMALRAVTVGYGYESIAQAAFQQILNGNNLTRASVVELEAAELFTHLVSADMVKFAKNGSSVTTAAVKLARAYTGKKYIALCAQHPFFSYDDWFVGTTAITRGVPEEVISLTLKFNYNDIDSVKMLFEQYPNQIACVILEPATSTLSPCSPHCNHSIYSHQSCSEHHCVNINFLQMVEQVCKHNGSLFILDEMITGFRWNLHGAQKIYNVTPDLLTFGKGMANGFSVAALAGKREVMELGGIQPEGRERVFLLSTTHGAEMAGLGAFIKTVEIYKEVDVIDHIWQYGRKLIDNMNEIARQIGISDYFWVEGFPCSPNYVTKDKNVKDSFGFRTLFSQEMITNGVMMPWISLSYSHGELELQKTLEATTKALKTYNLALETSVEQYLMGNTIRPVFRKYN